MLDLPVTVDHTITTWMHYRRDKDKNATFFIFVLVLRDFLIPATSADLLWTRLEIANPYNEGRQMGIKKFSNWWTEIQLKVMDKMGKESILEEVKKRKFSNYLPQHIEQTLMPQTKQDCTYKYLGPAAESYELSKRQITLLTTATCAPHQTSTKSHNTDLNRLRNWRQQ